MKTFLEKNFKNTIFSKYYSIIIGITTLIVLLLLKINIIFTVFISLMIPIIINLIKKYKILKHEINITKQIPEILNALVNAMKAGYSFHQALEFVARESFDPIKTNLDKAVKRIKYNFSIEEVLINLKKETHHQDMDMVVDGILMQYKIGGNLITMLERMAKLLQEKMKIQNDIKTFTAQGRYSGIIVSLLFPISITMFYIISPEYIEIMFNTILGQLFMILAVILEIIGFKLIWKITHIKV